MVETMDFIWHVYFLDSSQGSLMEHAEYNKINCENELIYLLSHLL